MHVGLKTLSLSQRTSKNSMYEVYVGSRLQPKRQKITNKLERLEWIKNSSYDVISLFFFPHLTFKAFKNNTVIDELLNQRNLEKGNLPKLMRLLMTT
jgi:hypothetical protein